MTITEDDMPAEIENLAVQNLNDSIVRCFMLFLLALAGVIISLFFAGICWQQGAMVAIAIGSFGQMVRYAKKVSVLKKEDKSDGR